MAYAPNSELVAMTYFRSILSPTLNVGTTLPEDRTTWTEGFVQLTVVGGAPNRYVPTRQPLIQIDVWVPSVNGSKPKWNRANTIAEDIVNALYLDENKPRLLDLGNYQDALVQEVVPTLEPRRISGDPENHARYSFDVQFFWTTSENFVA